MNIDESIMNVDFEANYHRTRYSNDHSKQWFRVLRKKQQYQVAVMIESIVRIYRSEKSRIYSTS